MVQFLAHILLGFIVPDLENDLDMHRMSHVKYIALHILGSIIYFWVLSTYWKTLSQGKYAIRDRYSFGAHSIPSAPHVENKYEIEESPSEIALRKKAQAF